ncbi:hypothetical protein Lal_00047397 [Lupinus albus]|uniref:Non-structural maintenance of chromosomes element 4 n=1 Tax=Lupinus albus TaxID=3870 RepID=A0A6A5MVD6_LUPAL|nr:putative non-structural maintenance of chromosome element 4, Nse4/EID family [Lupinus albus]KAF1878726.1 hypothetical protein Lal_00047397 [Lupinus albus]
MKGGSKRKIDGGKEEFRAAKRERLNENAEEEEHEQDPATRRIIRSQFLELKTLINDKRDDLMNTDSDKFDTILNELKKLHDQVQKPREQVADAEALLDLTLTLLGSVKSLLNEGITPAQFVGSLLKDYGQEGTENSVDWKKLGMAVSPIFMNVHGCCTMLGPMENELKQPKVGVQRRQTKPTAEKARPEELDESNEVEKADTDKNMITMFNVMKKNTKGVPLESLILNRTSFAQTVENLFTLSFLVKEGRANIRVDENRLHYVEPKNAPKTQETYTHFVFRYDYQDWKLMKDTVPEGKELMPHRGQFCTVIDSQPEMGCDNSQPALSVTPIRKLSRNRGRTVQEDGVVEESPQCDEENVSRAVAIRRCKRKLH